MAAFGVAERPTQYPHAARLTVINRWQYLPLSNLLRCRFCHCINVNKEDGTLLYYNNYMYSDEKFVEEEKERSKKIYRRRKNLDGLV